MLDNIYTVTQSGCKLWQIYRDLHIRNHSYIFFDRDKEKTASSEVTRGHLNRTRGVKIVQLLLCIYRISDRVKSSKCGKQYNTWNNLRASFRPYRPNHYDRCTKQAENSASWIYGSAKYFDNETADNESIW